MPKRDWSYWELACADCIELYSLHRRAGEWTIYHCPKCKHEVLVRVSNAPENVDKPISVNASTREDDL